ncbi:MAG: hypothetical protein C0483_09895 [Pirellula sp.]|nr:hypothetical protein [Pirellula sp.]
MESLQGKLLIASPELRDPNFFHSVVLMVKHNVEGALGLVLNRPLDVHLPQVWNQVSEAPCRRNDLIYLGGPCEGPLMAVHDQADLGESEVALGLHFSTDRGALEQLAAEPDRLVRFFAGFAGWSEGQLEAELAEESWHILPATAQHAFSTETDLWDKVMRELKGREIIDVLKIREIPPDLRAN